MPETSRDVHARECSSLPLQQHARISSQRSFMRRQQATVAAARAARSSRDAGLRAPTTEPEIRASCSSRPAPSRGARARRRRRHTRTCPGLRGSACRFPRAPTSFPGFGSINNIFIRECYTRAVELNSTPPIIRASTCHAMPRHTAGAPPHAARALVDLLATNQESQRTQPRTLVPMRRSFRVYLIGWDSSKMLARSHCIGRSKMRPPGRGP
jgi:hypothetical protein